MPIYIENILKIRKYKTYQTLQKKLLHTFVPIQSKNKENQDKNIQRFIRLQSTNIGRKYEEKKKWLSAGPK